MSRRSAGGEQPVYFPLGGGMDLITPAVSKAPGRVIASLNYEPTADGYSRLRGFERLDGRTAPSTSTVPATIATLRAAITAVPGIDEVRGVWMLNDTILAFRNTNTNRLKVWKATPAGWTEALFGYAIQFNFPVELIPDGTAITSSSGGAGVVTRTSLRTGSWTGNSTADIGNLLLQSYTGTFNVGDNILVGGVVKAKVRQTIRVVDYPKDGDNWKFLNYNFYGTTQRSLFFISGTEPPYEYDGANLVPIFIIDSKGAELWPTSIAVHRNAICFGYESQLYISGPGDPYNWDGTKGAVQIGVGDDIVDLVSAPGSLVILCKNSVHVLYGNDASDFQLDTLTREAGALEFTVQRFGSVLYMDNRGVRTLGTTQAFGNFTTGTISHHIAPLLEDKRRDGVKPVASFVSRQKDQYWVFFSDGSGVIFYMGAKEPSILPFDLGKMVKTAASVEDSSGGEHLLIGCSDGFVYELNKGRSFDGAAIEHYLRLPFNHFGTPRVRKRIHKVSVDLTANGPTTILVSADYDYGADQGTETQTLAVTTGGAAIDSLGTNELYYAAQIETQAEAYLDGVARNASLKIGGLTSNEEPHTLTGITYHISPRGLER